MKLSATAKRISCFMVAMILVFFSAGFALPVSSQEGAVSLGFSEVATPERFQAALADPSIGTIRLSTSLDVDGINWGAVQNGSKTIVGATGGERLTLPATIHMTSAVSFESVILAGSPQMLFAEIPPVNRTIYANGNRFRLGAGVVTELNAIHALYGGGAGNVSSTEIVLESGYIQTVYACSVNGTVLGNATVTASGNGRMGVLYGRTATGFVNGTVALTLSQLGTAAAPATPVLPLSGVDTVTIDHSYLKLTEWPFQARNAVVKNSELWFDSSLSLSVPLYGEASTIKLTAGTTLSIPAQSAVPGFISGRFSVRLHNGDTATIANGGPYRSLLDLPASMHSGTGDALTLTQMQISGIALQTVPAKTSYRTGEGLDTTGGSLLVSYAPAALQYTEQIPLTADMVTGFETNRVGQQTLTCTYQGKTTTYSIWMADSSVARLTLTKPDKSTYQVGDSLRLTGGRVHVRYSNGSELNIAMTDSSVMVKGFDSDTVGRQELTVYYNGQEAGVFAVNVRRSTADDDDDDDDDRSSNRSNNIPDAERTVAIKDVPTSTVYVGDSFTLRPSPDRGGNWEWDEDFFDAEIDRYTSEATFTALRAGTSRIYYSDRYAKDSVSVAVKKVPVSSSSREESSSQSSAAPSRPSGNPGGTTSSAPPPAISSQPESKPPSSSAAPEVSREPEPKPEPVVTVQPPDESRPVENNDTPQGILKDNADKLPAVIGGISASIVLLAAAGFIIWKYAGNNAG
ncbi:bacterial Ig-like domain-containing protein [Ruminococcaceae bacterium OttesenSCG-928-L11]|nr:bacterial Ig-like domain-containing protein [Ruminococcaceae bacterium OttesenSCG-928-L11]